MSTAAILESLGSQLKAVRERQGLSLEELAAATGMSKAHLSRIESGERQPAIATLLSLASALDVRVGALLGDGDATEALGIYPPHASAPAHETTGLRIEPCSGFDGSRDLQGLRVSIGPHRPTPAFATHPGEEWLYVLSGTVHLEYGGRTTTLAAGTTAHFDANQPHRLSAPAGEAELVLVATSPPHRSPERHY